jgi:hypothetical protein
MAIRLIPMRHATQDFRVERDGDQIGFVYRDFDTGEWLLTADAIRFETRAELPAPFARWTYEFGSLPELCAFLSAPIPAFPATLNLSEAA